MLRKILLISIITGFFCFSFVLGLKAQKNPDEDSGISGVLEKLSQIEINVGQLSTSLDKTNKGILKKLDQVLSNQEKIINELEIVKVRASRR